MEQPNQVLQERGTNLRDAYARAGVDIGAGNAAVERYRDVTKGWRHPNQLGAIGGFSGLFALPGDDARALVASSDGVGTKILIAAELQRYGTVGADLVNHCINDILVTNAAPLFFLDYLAVGRLDPAIAGAIVAGVNAACQASGIALLGGETAEMPGLYAPTHFDLAGTVVGIVEVAKVPDPARVAAGDAIVGLPAVGLHTNGYSLARALIPASEWGAPFADYGPDATYADALLAPHPSYAEPVRAIAAACDIKAMAHITGGGLLENVPRTLPPSCKAVFEAARWQVPALERELVRRGGLSHEERYRTFNMGIGYTLIVPLAGVPAALEVAPNAAVVGWVETRRAGDPAVIVHPARSA
jgi:phosphoribosylformylglycinamidine cyclo-ligase